MRDLTRLPVEMSSIITVVNGDSTVKDDVVKAIRGQDAVIVALGTRHDLSRLHFLAECLTKYLKSCLFKIFRLYYCHVRQSEINFRHHV